MAAPEANRGLKDASQRNKAIKLAGVSATAAALRGGCGRTLARLQGCFLVVLLWPPAA
jgi:hypothetical protein